MSFLSYASSKLKSFRRSVLLSSTSTRASEEQGIILVHDLSTSCVCMDEGIYEMGEVSLSLHTQWRMVMSYRRAPTITRRQGREAAVLFPSVSHQSLSRSHASHTRTHVQRRLRKEGVLHQSQYPLPKIGLRHLRRRDLAGVAAGRARQGDTLNEFHLRNRLFSLPHSVMD